ncbi:hypothetical protein BC827DRAFT_930761 [Russula dissimulans]|nr:hypothetical protein BC827DRAFT_930761 [Russula dissimulans]
MRATLHISLLAATLSPSLVHSSPIPFAQNYNSSPRSSAQAISESSRPGGAFSSRSLLTRGGSHGLGLFNLGSKNGGNGGDASSGSSFAYGGEDHHDKEDDHSAGGGGAPVIDLGPITPASDQPEQPPHTGNDADPKPEAHTPGEPVSLPPEPDKGIDHNLDDGGNKPPDGGTPGNYVNPNDTTPPPGPAPDPAAGNSTPDIPIFLGPSGKDPSHGGSNPPYDAPKASEYPGDGGGHKYTDDSPCDGPFGESLINLLSNNGGNGGDASSGAATSVGHGGDGSTSAYSGAGGYAAGGSVKAAPALINILSDNGGDGGDAESGDSYSYRYKTRTCTTESQLIDR